MSLKRYLFTTIISSLFFATIVNATTITTKKLSDNLYVFYAGKGLGLNVTASIGKDGILLVDTMNVRRGGDKNS